MHEAARWPCVGPAGREAAAGAGAGAGGEVALGAPAAAPTHPGQGCHPPSSCAQLHVHAKALRWRLLAATPPLNDLTYNYASCSDARHLRDAHQDHQLRAPLPRHARLPRGRDAHDEHDPRRRRRQVRRTPRRRTRRRPPSQPHPDLRGPRTVTPPRSKCRSPIPSAPLSALGRPALPPPLRPLRSFTRALCPRAGLSSRTTTT